MSSSRWMGPPRYRPRGEGEDLPGDVASVRCAFCRGSGRDPGVQSKLPSACIACSGRGKVLISQPYETCPACDGRGRHSGTVGAVKYCWPCRGKGVVPVQYTDGTI